MAQFLDLTGLTRYKNKSDALYAKQDGSYEGMTVGNAEQLVSTVGVSDNAPYTFRTTGGYADVGDRMNLKAVVGVSVPWNQLVKNGNFAQASNWSWRQTGGGSVSNNEASLIALSANNNQQFFQNISFVANHKYLVSFDIRTSGSSNTLRYGLFSSATEKTAKSTDISSSKVKINNIFAPTVNCDNLRFGFYLPSVNDTAYFSSVNCYDLTAMFGSTIADYVYTLESGTAGAGIAWLKKYGWFTKPYYPYKAASLESVKTSAHKTYGFNAYDNTTGKAKVVGGMVYQITGAYTALSLDGTSITPDANGYFTPSANGELTVTGGNGTTTCIHLKWDGERDGEYEPYEAHTYALDDVELRGIPKLDASNNLYYDGDVYTPDGTVTRKYGIVDLGTLSWEKTSGKNNLFNTRTSLSTAAYGGTNSDVCKAICAKYVAASSTNTYSNETDKTVSFTSTGYCYIEDTAYTDAATFKAAMSGVYLVYELATPTTEAASSYQQTQIVDDFGTEEFTDAATRDFEMPCGSLSVYQPNLRAKLEMAPNSPDGDGDYLVRQTNGTNEYVLFSEVKELPDMPTTDGTYVLKCTVADGTATLSWVSE